MRCKGWTADGKFQCQKEALSPMSRFCEEHQLARTAHARRLDVALADAQVSARRLRPSERDISDALDRLRSKTSATEQLVIDRPADSRRIADAIIEMLNADAHSIGRVTDAKIRAAIDAFTTSYLLKVSTALHCEWMDVITSRVKDAFKMKERSQ